MNATKKFALSLTALALLGACGGSSTGSDTLSFAEVAETSDTLFERVDDLAATPEDQLPSGTATYEGFVAVTEPEIDDDISFRAIGSLEFAINFDEQTVSGSAGNFFEIDLDTVDEDEFADATGTAISGSMTLEGDEDGTILSGSLTKLDGEEASYSIPVSDSEILGDTGEFIASTGEDGVSSAAGRDDALAEFLAIVERN